MKNYFILLSLVCIISSYSYAQSTNDEKYEQAKRYYEVKEYDKSIPILNELVARNHTNAFNLLGVCYNNGYGVKKDVDKAYEYYLKGAEKGNYHAQRNLAWLFQDNEFMEKHTSGEGDSYHEDYDFKRQTEKWLRIAAQNNADYMYELAGFYLDLQCLDEWQDKDPNIYLQKAADAGSANAQACLGYKYMIENKYDEAIKLLQLAKSHGCKTFVSFEYADEKELDVELLLKICQYFKENDKFGFKEIAALYNNQLLVIIKDNSDTEGFLLFSKSGAVIAQTSCFFKDLFYHDQYLGYCDYSNDAASYKNNHSIKCINTEIDIEVLNAMYYFLQNHKEYTFKDGVYEGGDYIYAICISNGKRGFLKISKNKGIVSSTSFDYDDLYYEYHNNPYFKIGDGYIHYIDSNISMDAVFVLDKFFKKNVEYKLLTAIHFNKELYISVENDNTHKYRWLKISRNSTILSSTPYSDNLYNYDLSKNEFSSYAYGKQQVLSFQEMMSQFK